METEWLVVIHIDKLWLKACEELVSRHWFVPTDADWFQIVDDDELRETDWLMLKIDKVVVSTDFEDTWERKKKKNRVPESCGLFSKKNWFSGFTLGVRIYLFIYFSITFEAMFFTNISRVRNLVLYLVGWFDAYFIFNLKLLESSRQLRTRNLQVLFSEVLFRIFGSLFYTSGKIFNEIIINHFYDHRGSLTL